MSPAVLVGGSHDKCAPSVLCKRSNINKDYTLHLSLQVKATMLLICINIKKSDQQPLQSNLKKPYFYENLENKVIILLGIQPSRQI